MRHRANTHATNNLGDCVRALLADECQHQPMNAWLAVLSCGAPCSLSFRSRTSLALGMPHSFMSSSDALTGAGFAAWAAWAGVGMLNFTRALGGAWQKELYPIQSQSLRLTNDSNYPSFTLINADYTLNETLYTVCPSKIINFLPSKGLMLLKTLRCAGVPRFIGFPMAYAYTVSGYQVPVG
ncbi:hypothetical protein FB451DRAFT_1405861 [Mycena latifolia]|nr:hypothetical protein FB451DRAFT_1405861 [Mycena latifolia]